MKPTIAAFTDLPEGLTFDELVRCAGRSDEDIGSGIFIWVYHLADGSKVFVKSVSSDGKRIDSVAHIVGDQHTELYPVPK